MKPDSRSVVLVVDDVPANIALMRAVLEPAGYKVMAACDGPMALQMAQGSRPDLILLEVMMPGMDGYAVCARLKQGVSTRHIPIIFVTAADDAQAEARGFAMGAADYIAKPIKLPVVLARVKTHLALSAQRRSLEGMFRDVMEFAPDAFILSDTQGVIVQINAQAERLFGYSRQALLGLPVEALIPQRLRGGHEDHRNAYVKRSHRIVMGTHAQCLRQDGSEFSAEINLSPLESNRGRLLMAVVRDVTERRKAELEIAESHQRLRDLATQNEATREGERKHIAREIHDELGQVLTALRMDMSLLGMQFGSLAPALAGKVSDMKVLVDRAIQGVRDVATNLRPTALDMGLIPALAWLCSEFTRHTTIACTLHTQEETIALDETRAVGVFRIVQESLTNITRYAHASQVDIALQLHDDALSVEVRDNGLGFDLAAVAARKSFGLLGMRERAMAMGGQLDVVTAVGEGTVIGVSIPIDFEPAKDCS